MKKKQLILIIKGCIFAVGLTVMLILAIPYLKESERLNQLFETDGNGDFLRIARILTYRAELCLMLYVITVILLNQWIDFVLFADKRKLSDCISNAVLTIAIAVGSILFVVLAGREIMTKYGWIFMMIFLIVILLIQFFLPRFIGHFVNNKKTVVQNLRDK
jgi:MFS family permease